jgi:hypothetical protein
MLSERKRGAGKLQKINPNELKLQVNKYHLILLLVGAQIRRENEKKHQENIEYILKINEEHLAKSDVIYFHAPGFNKTIFIGDNKPLTSYAKKIVNIPYSVQRANYTNVMEVYQKLVSVHLEINDEAVSKLFK